MKTYKLYIYNSEGGYPVELINYETELVFKQPERLNEKTPEFINHNWDIDFRDAIVRTLDES
jgi:hypothetical protein